MQPLTMEGHALAVHWKALGVATGGQPGRARRQIGATSAPGVREGFVLLGGVLW